MFLLIVMTVSCKKTSNIPSELIGTWQEQSPCVAGAGSCFQFQITSSNKYYEYSPAIDTGTYILSNNNNSITFTGDLGIGVIGGKCNIQLIDGNQLILDSFYTPINGGLNIIPAENVTLTKIN